MKTVAEMERYRQAILRRGVAPETPSARDYGPPAGTFETPSTKSWLAFRGPVRDQGLEGSCAAYGMLKVYEMEHLRLTGERLNTSERFCYNVAKIVDVIPADFVEQHGTTLRAAAKVLRHYGVCDESDWPYIPGDRAHLGIPQFLGILHKARKRRIAQYRNLLKNGVNASALTVIKQALCRRPIVCGLVVHSNWLTAGPHGFISLGRDRFTWPARRAPFAESLRSWRELLRCEGGKWIGGHAVALALYDDNLVHDGRRGWFGFVNSWSQAWGDHGIGYIDYDSFIQSLISSYEIVLATESPADKNASRLDSVMHQSQDDDDLLEGVKTRVG